MAAPYEAVRAKDGYFVIGANNDRLWLRLCEALERPDLAADPSYKTNADRLANREALAADLEKTFVTAQTVIDWVSLLLGAGVPAGPISDYAEVFASDHAKAREMKMTVDHPIEGAIPEHRLSGEAQGDAPTDPPAPAAARRAQRRDFRRTRPLGQRTPARDGRPPVERGEVRLTIEGPVATIISIVLECATPCRSRCMTSYRPPAGGSPSTPGLRAAVFRGANGAFVAGTDIAEFRAFKSGDDGVRYEARLERGVAEVEALPVPTLAVIDGPATGGGLDDRDRMRPARRLEHAPVSARRLRARSAIASRAPT